MVGGGSDFARFKSSIVGAQPPPCDQDGNNAMILMWFCNMQCAMCSVLLSGSKECCSSSNLSCSAAYALCAVCSLCIMCSERCAARQKMCSVTHFWLQCAVSQTWAKQYVGACHNVHSRYIFSISFWHMQRKIL